MVSVCVNFWRVHYLTSSECASLGSKSEIMLNHITGVIDACFLLILFVMDSLHNRLSLKIALVRFRNFFLRENCWCWLGFQAKLSSTWWHVPIISVIVISSRIPPNFGTPSNFFFVSVNHYDLNYWILSNLWCLFFVLRFCCNAKTKIVGYCLSFCPKWTSKNQTRSNFSF